MSYVYLIISGNAVKIGIADSPKQRMAGLQTANYEQLRIFCAFECVDKTRAAQLENLLHRRYASDRLTGEWFSTNPEKIVADVLSDEKLRAFIISYQVHRIGMMEIISNLIAAKIEQAQDKVSGIQDRVSKGTQAEDFFVALAVALGVIQLILFGILISGAMPLNIVNPLLTLGFGLVVFFAIMLAWEFYEKVS